MLSLYGPDYCIQNIYRLAKAHDAALAPSDWDELRHGFLTFLDARQAKNSVNFNEDPFITDPEQELALANSFAQASLNDLNQEHVIGDAYDPEVKAEKIALARRALAGLLSRSDDLALVFGLTVHSIFVRGYQLAPGIRGSHGGSSSASIGAIWLAVNDQVDAFDLMEMYVHELTHHLLFIDELNHTQFNYDELTRKENFAQSAILKRPRPLDKVVHSIVVSTELILARQAFLNRHGKTAFHPASTDLAASTNAAIASTLTLPKAADLMTPHLFDMLDRCAEVCGRYDTKVAV